MLQLRRGLAFGLTFLLCLVAVSAFNYNVTINGPANNTNITSHSAVLNASVLNTLNPGGNTSNITFYNQTGGVINTTINVFNNTPVTYTWTGLGDGTYIWYAVATGLNGTGISLNSTFIIDTTGPVVSNVSVTNLNSSQTLITYTTDVLANSSVNYGQGPSMGTLVKNVTPSIQHQVVFNVNPSSLYYYQITSWDSLGNSAVDAQRSFTSQGGACFANSSGITSTVLLAVGIFCAIAVLFLFIGMEVVSIEYIASALVATVFVVALIPGIC